MPRTQVLRQKTKKQAGERNMLVFVAVVVGALMAFAIDWYIPVTLSSYAAIVILAALDSIFGGCRALLEKKFDAVIFVTGLTGNSVIAVLLMFIGKSLGADLYLAAVLVFGTRMFQNFASIRRFYLNKTLGKKSKGKEISSKTDEVIVKTTINEEEI